MRFPMAVLLIAFCLSFAALAQAQTSPEDVPPVTPDQLDARLSELDALQTEQAAILEEMQAIRDRVTEAEDRAFNLLGLFEAFGIVVGVVIGAAGFVGLAQIRSTQLELSSARERVEAEARSFSTRFDEEIGKREAELEVLRSEITRTAAEERQSTSQALLANSLIPLGERQYKTGDYTGALNTYNRALELDARNPVVHQRLGYVYTANGDLEMARYHYEKAIALEENFAPALAGLGFVYRRFSEQLEEGIERTRMLNKAEHLLLQALSLSPKLVDDDGESWWGVLGGLYKRRGQIDDAILAYEQATSVTPQSSYGAGNLALLYMRKQDIPRMMQIYERVEQIAEHEAHQEQGNFWGFADLIVSRYALGKNKLAEDTLPMALDIAPPESPYMLDALASTLEELVEALPPDRIDSIQAAVSRIKAHQVTVAAELARQKDERARQGNQS